MRWAEHLAHMGEKRNACRMFVTKPEGRRSLGRPRHRWEDITMDVKHIGWESLDWIDVVQDRDKWQAVVNAVMKLWGP